MRSRPCSSSALPAKIIFTARWKLVTLSASYVKFKNENVAHVHASRGRTEYESEASLDASLSNERQSRFG